MPEVTRAKSFIPKPRDNKTIKEPKKLSKFFSFKNLHNTQCDAVFSKNRCQTQAFDSFS